MTTAQFATAANTDNNNFSQTILDAIARGAGHDHFDTELNTQTVIDLIERSGADAETIRSTLQANADGDYYTPQARQQMGAIANSVRLWMKQNNQTPGFSGSTSEFNHDPL